MFIHQARAALEHLVPGVTRCDPDGITLYFFNSQFEKYEGVQSADDVIALFDQTEPSGGTKLAKVFFDFRREIPVSNHS
jgi:hypothetical protein